MAKLTLEEPKNCSSLKHRNYTEVRWKVGMSGYACDKCLPAVLRNMGAWSRYQESAISVTEVVAP